MQSFAELEQQVDRALAELPPLAAPDTLLPRVLAAVQSWAERPWYQRAWLTWPMGMQVASVAMLMLLVVSGAMAIPTAQVLAARALSVLADPTVTDWQNMRNSFGVTASATVLVWRALIQPVLPFALGLAFLAGLVSAVLVTALTHVLPERSVQR